MAVASRSTTASYSRSQGVRQGHRHPDHRLEGRRQPRRRQGDRRAGRHGPVPDNDCLFYLRVSVPTDNVGRPRRSSASRRSTSTRSSRSMIRGPSGAVVPTPQTAAERRARRATTRTCRSATPAPRSSSPPTRRGTAAASRRHPRHRRHARPPEPADDHAPASARSSTGSPTPIRSRDDDPTWVDMQAPGQRPRRSRSSGVTYTAPAAGTYRIGAVQRARLRASAARSAATSTATATRPASSGIFARAVERRHEQRSGSTRTRTSSFADELAMTDYKVNYDVGYFGTDNPATPVARADAVRRPDRRQEQGRQHRHRLRRSTARTSPASSPATRCSAAR